MNPKQQQLLSRDTGLNFKKIFVHLNLNMICFRVKRPENLDRSDSFSSAEEDDEDFFEVFTADSLFSNLLDRVRNLTKRINKEGSLGPNWPGTMDDPSNFGLWNPSSSLRDLMAR
jgi:hypothetical protein